MAGYSRLMSTDERATVAALDQARSVFRRWIESNQGRVVDMAGDSVLAVFETAGGAVSASLAIQNELAQACEAVPEEHRMRFRIGVHLGAVMEKSDGTIYGDGVNIAARLESLAETVVLPFDNMSKDPDQEFFADGMVEAITATLSRIRSFFVIARNSAFLYKGKAIDVQQVGRDLGVRYLLEGSVQKAGSRLRITVQLIDTTNGAHV